MYPKVQMFIAGEWTDGTSGESEDILNPATGQPIGKTPHASRQDLDRALEAAKAGLRDLAQDLAVRPLQADAQGRRHHPLARRRDRTRDDHGAGQAGRGSPGRDHARRRPDRLVLQRKPAAPMAASCRRGSATSPSSVDEHRVQHVGEARRKELLGFLQRRYGNPAGAGVPLPSSDLNAFRGLDVRTQADAERIHALLHARDIAHHARFVDQRGGSGNVGRMQGSAFNQDIPRAPAAPGHRAPVRPQSAPIPYREVS